LSALEAEGVPGEDARVPATHASGGTIAARLVAAGVLVALDLWSKARVFDWLTTTRGGMRPDACDYPHMRQPLSGEWLSFMLSTNKGAAFGKLDSVPYLLVGGRIAAVGLLLYWIWRTPRTRAVLGVALTLVLAGAIGNLYDNLVLDPPPSDPEHPFGYVRDFIDVYFVGWRWHFPTINVADSCITVGAVLLFFTGLRRERPAEA
jgi:lipoprotein signal peptidase